MLETITLELPEPVLAQARELARRTNQSVEEVITEWLNQFTSEPPLESLSDADLLVAAQAQMSDADQSALSDLLEINREGRLTQTQDQELDRLMSAYRRGLVRKAQAWKLAVERHLLAPLS